MARRVSNKTRFEVFVRDSFTCQYCGTSAPRASLQIDHINPVSNGGDHDKSNLITACRDCNAGKGTTSMYGEPGVIEQYRRAALLRRDTEQLQMIKNERRIRRILMTGHFSVDDLLRERTEICGTEEWGDRLAEIESQIQRLGGDHDA